MKKALLLLTGLLPFLAGYVQNYCMLVIFFTMALPYGMIGFMSGAVWLLLGILLYPLANSAKQAAILTNLPAFAVLLLLLFQELALHQYLPNPIGLATQLFYLPFVGIARKLTSFSFSMSVTYIVAFLLMYGTFYLGCMLRKKHMAQGESFLC